MRKLLASISVIFIIITGSAAAQEKKGSVSATGTLIPGRTSSSPVWSSDLGSLDDTRRSDVESSSAEALKAARRMASCAVERKPEGVKALLNASSSPLYQAKLKILQPVMAKCLIEKEKQDVSSTMLKIGGATTYDLFSEAYFLRNGVPVLDSASQAEWLATVTPQNPPLSRIAGCLAYTQPQPVAAILRTLPGSDPEKTAFSALMPTIDVCVEKGGQTVIKRDALRLRLAGRTHFRALLVSQSRDHAAAGRKN